jgi:hypothetical protein
MGHPNKKQMPIRVIAAGQARTFSTVSDASRNRRCSVGGGQTTGAASATEATGTLLSGEEATRCEAQPQVQRANQKQTT